MRDEADPPKRSGRGASGPKRGRLHARSLLLPAIIAVAFVLRIIGIRYGFPLLVHSDEPVVVEPASHLILAHTLDPNFFARPNHFSIYLSAALYLPVSRLLLHQPFSVVHSTSLSDLYLTSRLVVAVLGTVSVLVAYYVGKEFSTRTGYLLAAAFAFFPPFVEHAHYATPDVPLTLLLLLVVLFTIRFLRDSSYLSLGLAVAAGALATTEKYPGALSLLLIVTVVVVVFARQPRKLALTVAGTIIGFGVAVALFAPYLVIRHSEVLANITGQATSGHLGSDGLGLLGNLRFYAHAYYVNSGLLLLIAMFFGLLGAGRAKGRARCSPSCSVSAIGWLSAGFPCTGTAGPCRCTSARWPSLVSVSTRLSSGSVRGGGSCRRLWCSRA